VTPVIDGKDVTSMSDQQRVHLRRETVTYIFQSLSLPRGNWTPRAASRSCACSAPSSGPRA
jgi:hypothetical protein